MSCGDVAGNVVISRESPEQTNAKLPVFIWPPADDDLVFLVSQTDGLQESLGAEKKVKGRTGWPQQVWALELNQ